MGLAQLARRLFARPVIEIEDDPDRIESPYADPIVTLSRRHFLFGALSAAAMVALAPVAPLVSPAPSYLGFEGLTSFEASELAAFTRRAFIPKIIAQINRATPTLSSMLVNARPASGGLRPISVPVF